MGWDGWISPGAMKYRAAYAANNIVRGVTHSPSIARKRLVKILWEKRRSIARKDEEKEGQERFCARKRSTMRGKRERRS